MECGLFSFSAKFLSEMAAIPSSAWPDGYAFSNRRAMFFVPSRLAFISMIFDLVVLLVIAVEFCLSHWL